MADLGHIRTDKQLAALERKIKYLYGIAAEDLDKKLNKYLQSYGKNLEKMQAAYSAGQVSDKEFTKWKKNHAAIIQNKKAVCNTIAKDLTNTDKIAANLISGHMPGVYALNYNFATYQVENLLKGSTSFALYDHATVENLLLYDDTLLPKWKIDEKKDYVWNYKNVKTSLTQGVLQGESIPKISERLRTGLCARDKNLMTTFARTATTGAQNRGRTAAYKEPWP